ncbi:hypothetical protein [Actinoplanes sp. NPDC051411]|uniref:hypothetical protein n=1 Tax=Actinoplanes sp. NPDC051411 TaxID=3155522 RepID=UPI00341803C1
MKRGLVVLDATETPPAEWDRRLTAVRADLRAAGVDVGLIYGDVFSSDDIAYLTNLCIYWNEGMLAIPADGDPVVLTKLSPRVFPWMRLTSTVRDIRSGRSFGTLVHDFLADRGPGVAGLVGADLWPAAVVDEVTASAPDWTVRPLGALVRAHRTRPSATEEALIRTAAGLIAEALARADGSIAELERRLRGVGFLDVRITTSTAGGSTSLQVLGQYRTVWAYAARILGPAPNGGVTQERWINQADLATLGEFRPAPDRPAEGEIGAVLVETVFPDGMLIRADTVRIGAGGPELLSVVRA